MIFNFSDLYQQDFRLKSPTSPMSRCFSESDLSLPPPKPPRSYNRRSQIENSNNQTYPRPLKLRLLELLQRNFNMFMTFFHKFRIYESMIFFFFFTNFFLFLLKQGRIFPLRSKMLLKLFIFTKKTLCSSSKRKHFS